jgi:hypothetical protein
MDKAIAKISDERARVLDLAEKRRAALPSLRAAVQVTRRARDEAAALDRGLDQARAALTKAETELADAEGALTGADRVVERLTTEYRAAAFAAWLVEFNRCDSVFTALYDKVTAGDAASIPQFRIVNLQRMDQACGLIPYATDTALQMRLRTAQRFDIRGLLYGSNVGATLNDLYNVRIPYSRDEWAEYERLLQQEDRAAEAARFKEVRTA